MTICIPACAPHADMHSRMRAPCRYAFPHARPSRLVPTRVRRCAAPRVPPVAIGWPLPGRHSARPLGSCGPPRAAHAERRRGRRGERECVSVCGDLHFRMLRFAFLYSAVRASACGGVRISVRDMCALLRARQLEAQCRASSALLRDLLDAPTALAACCTLTCVTRTFGIVCVFVFAVSPPVHPLL